MKRLPWYIFIVFLLLLPFGVKAQENEQAAAAYLWRMINEARAHPLETIRALGIDEEQARQALGDDAWVLDEGLPPVAWEDSVAQVSGSHLDDMVQNLYYSSTGLDGSTVLDRLLEAGYSNAAYADELLGAVSFAGFISPLEAAEIIFKSWIRSELDPTKGEPKKIFNPSWGVMGVAFKAAVLDLGQDLPANVYVAVADLVQLWEPQAFLFGNVYRDANGDGAMQMGEGLGGVEVQVKGYLTGEEQVVAGVAGQYCVPIPQGFFTVDVVDQEGNTLVTRAGFGDGTNYWLDLRIRKF